MIQTNNSTENYDECDIRRIAHSCGKATKSNGGWMCSCPISSHGRGRGDQNPSLSLSVGNDGQFLAKCFSGCTFEDVLDALKNQGLIKNQSISSQLTQRKSQPSGNLSDDQKKEPERKQKQAFSIWNTSINAKGTLVETYLQSRGLTVSPPDTLRFHPDLEYWEQREEGKPKLIGRFQAMIALVQKYPGEDCVGIHRTYLSPGGKSKASVPSPKKMLGSCLEGAVRFEGETLECIAIGEGIETCLTYWQDHPSMTVWAALTAGGLERIILPPPSVTPEVIILVDNDETGKKAALKKANLLTQEGRHVFLIMPSAFHLDMNSFAERS